MNRLFFHSKAAQGKPRVTICAIVEGETVKFGASRCGRKDQFVKKIGRQIAEGRALKNPLKTAKAPFENFSQWFSLHAKELAQEISANPQLL